jgi:FkbM family methyltransferase
VGSPCRKVKSCGHFLKGKVMVRRVDRPYVVNWLSWNFYHRHRGTKVERRRAAWEFINLVRQMPRGSVAIDGGANVGNVTAAFVRRGMEVHAFEPDPLARAVFTRRFRGNAAVHLYPAALGAQSGRTTLYRSQAFASRPIKSTVASSLIRHGEHSEDNSVTVEVIDLIAFIRQINRKVDILKLDVEGSEVEILERLFDEDLDRNIGAIFVETHERFSEELARRTEVLQRRVAAEGKTNVNLDWF